MNQSARLQGYLHDRFLTLTELAALTGLEGAAIQDLIAAGVLPQPSDTLWPTAPFPALSVDSMAPPLRDSRTISILPLPCGGRGAQG